MKIRIEYLETDESGVYEVSRVPCIGEYVRNLEIDNTFNKVVSVTHF